MAGRRRMALVAATMALSGVIALGGASAPADASAQADAWIRGSIGPYADQVTCNAASAAGNHPPDYYTFLCAYYASDPNPNWNRGAGWYYFYRAL